MKLVYLVDVRCAFCKLNGYFITIDVFDESHHEQDKTEEINGRYKTSVLGKTV